MDKGRSSNNNFYGISRNFHRRPRYSSTEYTVLRTAYYCRCRSCFNLEGEGDNKLVPRWWSSYFVDMIVVTSAGGGREEEVAFTEYGGNLRWKDLLRV